MIEIKTKTDRKVLLSTELNEMTEQRELCWGGTKQQGAGLEGKWV